MLSFLLLEESALARSPDLIKWIKGWASTLGKEVEVLDQAGWFEQRHFHDGGEMKTKGFWILKFQAGTFFWIPAPVVARIVLEELRQDRQKLTQSAHMLGVPRMLSSEWRRHIYKSADLIIEIPAGCGEI